MITSETSLPELAVLVSEELARHEISAVLTGGAAVTIWTNGRYTSYDLDFISPAAEKAIRSAMAGLGFIKRGKDYVHAKTKFFVEFPTGPLAVGQALATSADTFQLKKAGGSIRIISPTFSVMDRLAQYFYWNDRGALDQAVAVAVTNAIDWGRIEAWAKAEGVASQLAAVRLRFAKR